MALVDDRVAGTVLTVSCKSELIKPDPPKDWKNLTKTLKNIQNVFNFVLDHTILERNRR